MGDEDHRHAPAFKHADELQHLVLLGHAQIVGRFDHDHEPGVPIDRACNRHCLTLAARELLDRLGQGRNANVQGVERLPRLLTHMFVVERLEEASEPALATAIPVPT